MEIPVFDFHAHVGRWGNLAVWDDIERYINVMDAAGVDRANINCIFYLIWHHTIDQVFYFALVH